MAKRQKPRNFHACHPIMKKGGVHEKSKGALRAAAKRETRRKTGEWLGGTHSRFRMILPYLIDPRIILTLFNLMYRVSGSTCQRFK